MAPVVDRLTAEYQGRVGVKRFNVEKDKDASALASQYRVQYVPTFVFIGSDGRVAKTLVGEVKESDLKSALDALR